MSVARVAWRRSGAGVTTAGDASDRIVYDTSTGFVYYDADGSAGAFAAVHFATLVNHPAGVAAGDFFIVA